MLELENIKLGENYPIPSIINIEADCNPWRKNEIISDAFLLINMKRTIDRGVSKINKRLFWKITMHERL